MFLAGPAGHLLSGFVCLAFRHHAQYWAFSATSDQRSKSWDLFLGRPCLALVAGALSRQGRASQSSASKRLPMLREANTRTSKVSRSPTPTPSPTHNTRKQASLSTHSVPPP